MERLHDQCRLTNDFKLRTLDGQNNTRFGDTNGDCAIEARDSSSCSTEARDLHDSHLNNKDNDSNNDVDDQLNYPFKSINFKQINAKNQEHESNKETTTTANQINNCYEQLSSEIREAQANLIDQLIDRSKKLQIIGKTCDLNNECQANRQLETNSIDTNQSNGKF